jgi:L-seryl-tRNA(Ser) seleniumtransferase
MTSLRDIPAVHELLARPEIAELCAASGTEYVTAVVREVLANVREQLRAGKDVSELEESIVTAIHAAIREGLRPTLRPVINATGVILHTNLGRAPLSADAVRAVAEAAASYTNLEYDLSAGKRGKRDVHAAALFRRLLGVPAIVVNNNAAAVFLVLHELAGQNGGGEAIVSRGELVEIGGSFRVPDIMQRSGAILREVGTTNRTRVADYAQAAGERTSLLLRVHPSNFRMVGFTERPALEDLAALAKKLGVPLVEDLGSGCLFDPLLPISPIAPIEDEPKVADSLRAGADLVTFSCDKLMGGPQAGVIAGRADLIERVRRSPLFRALRVDKLTYAALGATLRSWITGRLDDLPVARMIGMKPAEIAERAQAFAAALQGIGWNAELLAGESVAGGGTTPGQTIPTTLVAVEHAGLSTTELERLLRAGSPPVIARVEDDRLLIDLRTVFREQESTLLDVLLRLRGRLATDARR